MSTLHWKIITCLLLLCLMFITFWIRIQGVQRLPEGQFTENDAYLYHWQAKEIIEHGILLPVKDMHRWLPVGRDNRQMLSLYAYTLAYTHKMLPGVSLYHIQLYAPALCFTLGLGVWFLFLTYTVIPLSDISAGKSAQTTYAVVFASIVTLLLATLPGSIERSAVGFGDRDAWCWFLGTLTVISYLWKEQMEPGWRRWIATVLSGFAAFLGGLSWEAFGTFLLIILCAETWKFCTTDKELHLKEYIIWIFMFVPWLYLASPAYRSGYGFTTHLAALMLFPTLVVLAMRGLRYLLLHFYKPLRSHARKLAWGLTLLGITVGVTYLFIQSSTFETTTFVFRESRLMKNVGELVDPHFKYWLRRYGTVFILGSLGLIVASLHLWKWKGLPLTLSLSLFIATTFFREQINGLIGDGKCDILFLISLGLTAFCFAIACLRKEEISPSVSIMKNELVTITVLVWFLLWVGLSRGGKRHDFFIGVPLAFGTAWLLWLLPKLLIQKLKDTKILYSQVNIQRAASCVTIVVLIPVLFWNPLGGHATRAVYATVEMRQPTPGQGTPIAQTLTWMKDTLPQNAVVAANWGYGSQLNVLGGVNTIIDQDHFIPHWIHLYYRHVFCAQYVREALEFLKTHGATHLMLTDWGLATRSEAYSFIGSIGSEEKPDRRFRLTRLAVRNKYIYNREHTPFLYIELPDITAFPDFLTARLKNGNSARLPYIVFQDKERYTYKTSNDENLHGSVILYYDENQNLEKAYHVSVIGWQSLAVRLYYLGDRPDIFVPIYPTNGDDTAPVKIWEIHYPPDIKTNPKYLEIGFPKKYSKL